MVSSSFKSGILCVDKRCASEIDKIHAVDFGNICTVRGDRICVETMPDGGCAVTHPPPGLVFGLVVLRGRIRESSRLRS